MKVLVTDGDTRAALAVTRSLGRIGHHVVVGERRAPSLAQASRYCASRFTYSDPVSDSDHFVDDVAREVEQRRIDVLMPITDITTFLITGHRDRFAASCAIPFAPAATLLRAANKVDMLQTAERLGVPVPRSIVVCHRDEIADRDHQFPLVIKPQRSRVLTAKGWMSSAVSYAGDREQLVRDLASRPAHDFPLMLQERIIGSGVGVFACYHEGHAVALFSHRRLRERPPSGGVSVVSESTAVCPLAGEYATRLLNDLQWHGVAMVEFKHDVRDNLPKLMEINGRFWGSLQLAVDAGVDFPGLLVQSVRVGTFDPQPPYRIGVRNRWLWGDFDSLLLTLSGRDAAPDRKDASRLEALLEFMKFWGKDLYYDNPKWDDLVPWFLESYRWVEAGARGALHRMPGR